MPKPNAKPDHSSGSMPHTDSTLGCTMPQPPSSIQPVSEHVRRTVQIRDGRTSTEVLRSTRVDEHGAEQAIAEEFAVLDRVGRLQLPHEFVTGLGLRDRVRLALEPDHVQVRPGHDGATRPGDAPPAASAPASGDDHTEEAR